MLGLRAMRLSSPPSRRFYFARRIRHTGISVATPRVVSIFPPDSGITSRKKISSLGGKSEKNLARLSFQCGTVEEARIVSATFLTAVRGSYGGSGKSVFSPRDDGCFVGKRISRNDARYRGYRRRAYSGIRIVSSRHEPLVKNIRSTFKGENETKERGEKERKHQVFVHLCGMRWSHRIRFPSLPGRRTNEYKLTSQCARITGGFPRKNICFSFRARLAGSLRALRRARYINYAAIRCTKVAKTGKSRLEKRRLNGVGFEPEGIKSLFYLFFLSYGLGRIPLVIS